jgi:glycosyltransferase involved in cell wall biosynthesis
VSPDATGAEQLGTRSAMVRAAREPHVTLVNVSQSGARSYARWLDVKEQSVVVIPNGIARAEALPAETISAFKRELGVPEGAPIVGNVARFYPEKEPREWIEAAARIRDAHPDAHFLFSGWGPLEEDFRRAAQEHRLGERVHIIGPGRAPTALMFKAMDVFLLSSSTEGLPNVVLEAQSHGVPVVTTNAGDVSSGVDDGNSAIVVPVHDVVQMATAVNRVLADRELRARMGRAGPRIVEERFSVDRMVDATLAVYAHPEAP